VPGAYLVSCKPVMMGPLRDGRVLVIPGMGGLDPRAGPQYRRKRSACRTAYLGLGSPQRGIPVDRGSPKYRAMAGSDMRKDRSRGTS
jgi:hypothetical protein